MTMTFNFDKQTCRRGSGCIKWDYPLPMGVKLTEEQRERVIPLWVADMDFEAPQFIVDALQRRLDQGVFGYTMVMDPFYQAIIRWFWARHNLQLRREWIQYTPGVVPALSAVIKAMAGPGEGVIVQSPVYNCFFLDFFNPDCIVLCGGISNAGDLIIKPAKEQIKKRAFKTAAKACKIVVSSRRKRF